MRTEPGGGELVERIGRRTEFGSPSVFGVVEQRGDWAGVTTPLLPNGQLGWIKLDPERLEGGWTRYSIVVDLSDRSADAARGRARPSAASRSPSAPPAPTTPTGRFAVTDTFSGARLGRLRLLRARAQRDPAEPALGLARRATDRDPRHHRPARGRRLARLRPGRRRRRRRSWSTGCRSARRCSSAA